MVKTAYSQFPVRDGESIVGSITERGINTRLFEGDPEMIGKLLVGAVMEEPFPIVSANTPVAVVIDLLQTCHAVLTAEKGRVVGIVTNADIGKIFDLLETN